MAIKKKGIALLVTVIFMSVMLAFGVSLAALSYKQSVLASTASQSETAFFAADAILECTLYADQHQGAYLYENYSANLTQSQVDTLASYAATACDGSVYGRATGSWSSGASGVLTMTERVSFDNSKRCADIAIYKYANPLASGTRAFLFSTGYNVSCDALGSTARIVSRGIYAHY
jgi:Tfp pilus assembly protein PilE